MHFFRGEFIGIESGACQHHEKRLGLSMVSASFHVRAEQDRPAGERSKLGSVERFPRGASEVRNEMIQMTRKGRPIGGAGFVSSGAADGWGSLKRKAGKASESKIICIVSPEYTRKPKEK